MKDMNAEKAMLDGDGEEWIYGQSANNGIDTTTLGSRGGQWFQPQGPRLRSLRKVRVILAFYSPKSVLHSHDDGIPREMLSGHKAEGVQ